MAYPGKAKRDLSEDDKEIFLEVVRNYLNVVECKKTDIGLTTCKKKRKNLGNN